MISFSGLLKSTALFWRGRALHSIVVTSPWPGKEHSREVANSNEGEKKREKKEEEKKRGGVGGGGGRWALDGWIRKIFCAAVRQQHCIAALKTGPVH